MAPAKKSKIVVLRVPGDFLRTVPATPTHSRVKNALAGNLASSPTPGGTPEPKASKSKGGPGKRKGPKGSAAGADGSGSSRALQAPSSPYGGDDHVGTPKPSGSGGPGPKTAMAATVAGVKALDRSGKPCRRWTKKEVQISSFTGVRYALGVWTGEPDKDMSDKDKTGDAKSNKASNKSSSNKDNSETTGKSKDTTDKGDARDTGKHAGKENNDPNKPTSDVNTDDKTRADDASGSNTEPPTSEKTDTTAVKLEQVAT
ncbi:hypothetical protein AWJ20_1696 [Sugiyamaella lignohabitans]|uniref:Uncharacterized protein n=1 Tax=Sugiyamaella lignohabitans TaxID=796027 RepID=A0A167DXC5_9ASCO|nr:uncharacterized protein AWJ20_1696 [Sugiyamaella lignohabitans]ANB13406.1 hypothetical protein AWJ20_1696 [Sugiyamaella lignohabitans]